MLRFIGAFGSCAAGVKKGLPAVATALLALSLAGCGGGGGGGGGSSEGRSGPTFSLSTTTVNFKAVSEAAPPSQTITGTVTGEASGTLYIIVTPNNPGIATVDNVAIGSTMGTASIIPGVPADIGAGNHTATISVRACLNDPTCNTNQLRGSPQTVTVSYSIDGVATSVPGPSGMHYYIVNARSNGDTTQTFNVTGSPNVTWTLSANEPWLTLSPTSGSTGSPVTVTATVPNDQIDRLRAGIATSLITVTPSSGVAARVQVVLHLDQSVVNNVGPYLDISSTAGDVIIRGANFANANVTGVSFGGNPATQFSVVNDTQINATHPPLPAGIYPVTITTNPGVARAYANLKIVEPATYAPAVLAYPGGAPAFVDQLVYDAERKAILVAVSAQGGRLYRYAYEGTSWAAPQDVPLPLWHSIALAANGETLIVSYPAPPAGTTVAEWDPATLTELKQANWGAAFDVSTANSGMSMAVAIDGVAVLATRNRCCTGHFSSFVYTQQALINLHNGGAADGVVGGSADGGTVLVGDAGVFSGPVYRYDSIRLPWLVPTNVSASPAAGIVINRNGSRIVMGRQNETMRVYDASLNVTGTLPVQPYSVALAPVSARAYAYDSGSNTVRVIDLTAPVAGVYPELAPIALPGNPGTQTKLVVSSDEQTLFVAGESGLIVQPL